MTTKENTAIAKRINRRVRMSEPMLKAMGVHPDVYERVALNMLVINPAVATCTLDSIDKAMLQAINAKLLPDGKESAIVPFQKQATFIPMIAGQTKLAMAATPGLSLRSRLVYKDDDWEYEEGLFPVLKHIPKATGSRTDQDIIAAYAVAEMPSTSKPMYHVMLRGDLDRHRGYSRTGNSGPWAQFYGPMCHKTVLRQLLKMLPTAPGMAEVPDELAGIELGDFGPPVLRVTQVPVDVPDTVTTAASALVNTVTGEVLDGPDTVDDLPWDDAPQKDPKPPQRQPALGDSEDDDSPF